MTKENDKILRRGFLVNKPGIGLVAASFALLTLGVVFQDYSAEQASPHHRHLLSLRFAKTSSQPIGFRNPESFITWCHAGDDDSNRDRCALADQTVGVTEDLEVFQLQLRRAMDARRMMTPDEHTSLAATFRDKLIRNLTFELGNRNQDSAYGVYATHAHALANVLLDSELLPEQQQLKKKKNLLWLEFGVHSGASVNISAHITRDTNIAIHGFDTFTGLPEDWVGHKPKGYFDLGGNFPDVEPGVQLHKGLFKDTLPRFTEEHKKDKIVGMNVDCDLYQGAIEALNMTHHMWTVGTMIHFHELQQSAASKEKKFAKQEEVQALHEFMFSHPGTVMEILPAQHKFQEPVVLVVTQLPY